MLNLVSRLIHTIQSCFERDTSASFLFKSIPHQRVVSKNVRAAEVIDLYSLGLFKVQHSHLAQCVAGTSEIVENIELVALQPQSEYKPHYHKYSAAVIYIVQGSGTFRLGDTVSDYYPGKHISIPAGVLHGFNTQTPTLFLSIQSPPILNPENGEVDLYYENSI